MKTREQLEEMYYELEDRGISLWEALCAYNECGNLNDFLVTTGNGDLADRDLCPADVSTVRVLVVGDSKPAAKVLEGVAKAMGYSSCRFDFVLGYEEGTRYNFENLKYRSQYGLVIFGAMRHSVCGKGDYSSIIEAMRWQDCYPHPIEALTQDGQLKITKTSFREALMEAMERGLIAPDICQDYNYSDYAA